MAFKNLTNINPLVSFRSPTSQPNGIHLNINSDLGHIYKHIYLLKILALPHFFFFSSLRALCECSSYCVLSPLDTARAPVVLKGNPSLCCRMPATLWLDLCTLLRGNHPMWNHTREATRPLTELRYVRFTARSDLNNLNHSAGIFPISSCQKCIFML